MASKQSTVIVPKPVNTDNFKLKLLKKAPHLDHPINAPWMFKNAYPNIYLLAKKESGKTTIVHNILERKADRDTTVIFFAGQVFRDHSYQQIVKQLRRKRIPYIVENSFYYTDDMGRQQSHIKELAKYLKDNSDDDVWEHLQHPLIDSDDEDILDTTDTPTTDTDEKPEKLIIVIDDLSKEIRRCVELEALLKENRHVRATIIVSTQELTDLPPKCINQFQYVLAFSKIPPERIEKLRNDLALNVPNHVLDALYKAATKPDVPGEKSHNFLYIDVDNNNFRRNFDTRYSIQN